ncbi:MAG TPA: carbohydrate kinase family protein, partial [Mesotoga infera]|nr:carbohydrate kinase family protein [Mesotoga infera]
MLRYIHIVKPSDDDARHIFGEMQPREYLDLFHEFGAKNVILTLGKRGAVVSDGFRIEEIAPCARRVVDTTGAGDAFWSGLYRGLLERKDIFEAARYGNMCAAFRIEHEGKDTQLPAIEELKTIYERC